jgi:hypothetical protein
MTSSRVACCLSAVLLVAGISGCGPSAESVAAASAVTVSAVTVSAGQGATIKVYRSFSAPAATAARVYLDHAFLGYVSNRSQNTFHVKPGTYRLSVKYPTAPALFPNRTKPFTLAEGQTLHFGIGFAGGGELVGSGQVSTLSAEEAVRVNERYPSRE